MAKMQAVSLAVFLVVSTVVHDTENKVLKKSVSGDAVDQAEITGNKQATELLAFSVARTTGYSLVGQVRYPEVVIDEGGAWNRDMGRLVVRDKGTYFIHVSAGAMPGDPVNVAVSGLPTGMALSRESTAHTGTDTMGRDFIASLELGSQVYVEQGSESALYGQGGRQISFTAIDLESFLNPNTLVIFCAARESPYASVGEVKFPKMFVNLGDAFDEEGLGRFHVNRTGIYFFTLSVGVPTGLNVRTQIKSVSSESTPYAELWRSSTSHNGPDTVSTSVMMELEAGDHVFAELMDGEIFSNEGHSTSFAGFYYDPEGGDPVAWCVYSENKHVAFDAGLDPLPFDDAWVNTNSMFRFGQVNRAFINQTGLYYVSLSIGVQDNYTIEASIVLDRNRVEASVYRSSTSHNGPDTLHQGMILRLSAGNNLRVVLAPGSRSHSDGDHQTIFTGFLIRPE